MAAARNRHQAARARGDARAWQVTRRERTRRLIELGGLVVKSRLAELADDDRATIYGALLMVVDAARGESNRPDDTAAALALWRRKGKRVFEAQSEGPDAPSQQ